MTWPFENDTSDIEKKLAKRSLHRERQRNLFAIIALVLTAFMITATFSIGFSYFETYQMQQIRLMGTTADVGITNVTENQLVEISKSNLVLDVGIQQRLGSVDTEQLQNVRLGIVWIDDTEWEHHRLPTISGVVGNYPSSKNEIMLPTWVLEQMGISDPQIGMEIVLSYKIGDSYDYVTDTFLLSGYYTDYIPMVSEIGQLDGIENLRLTYAPYPQVAADVVYDDAVFHEFLASLDGVNGIDFSDPAKLENYQQNFFSGVFGIDSAYLEEINKTLNLPIDTSAFEQGKVVLLSKTVEDLIQPGQEITIQTQNGQHSFIVANGYLNEGFRAGGGNERGTAPDLYISQTALKELFPQYRVFRVAFDTDGQHDESILQELKQITASQANIDIISRYERREEMQEYLITAKVLGTGLSVILLLVGVMNFVNTMVVNVNTRRYELAILESIGMTKRQIKQMLLMEGFYYWGISLSLAVTIGTAIFILLYMIFSKVAYYAVFSYPFIPLVLVSGLVLLICLIVPIWVYKTDVNLPVVERLRLTE